MSRYTKFFAALAATVLLAGQLLADGEFTAKDLGLLLTSFAGAAAVFFAPNRESGAGDDGGFTMIQVAACVVAIVGIVWLLDRFWR